LSIVNYQLSIAQSPITIDKNDMPNPGDTLRLSNASRQYNIDLTQTGANVTWDYHDLQSLSQSVDTFIHPPNAYILAFENVFDPQHFSTVAAPIPSPGSFPGSGVTFSESYEFIFGINQYQSPFSSHFSASRKQGKGIFFEDAIIIFRYYSLFNNFFPRNIFIMPLFRLG